MIVATAVTVSSTAIPSVPASEKAPFPPSVSLGGVSGIIGMNAFTPEYSLPFWKKHSLPWARMKGGGGLPLLPACSLFGTLASFTAGQWIISSGFSLHLWSWDSSLIVKSGGLSCSVHRCGHVVQTVLLPWGRRSCIFSPVCPCQDKLLKDRITSQQDKHLASGCGNTSLNTCLCWREVELWDLFWLWWQHLSSRSCGEQVSLD